jgi:hypothetical protein
MPEQLRPGLWRWTAPHPECKPTDQPNSCDDWPPDVGCVLHQTDTQAVFIDALAPARPPRTSVALRQALAATLDGLDVELILVSHGEPTLRGGAAALARALQQPA